jgi:hypothetical protein
MRWKGPPGPVVPTVRSLGPANPAEPATIARHCLGELRSTRCPPPRKAPSGGGSPVRRPVANSSSECSLPRTPGPWCSLALRFPPELGHRLWWRARFLSPPKELRKRLEGSIFKILYDGSARPQEQLRYPQAEARCPPVVHQFIHTRAHVLVETTVCRGREMAARWAAR